MTAKYEAFTKFFFEIIRREADARESRDIVGNVRHYSPKANTFKKLHRLASEVVADKENAADVSELQRAAVAFVVNINADIFGSFINKLNGRYMVAARFYPQCIEEFTYKRRDWLPVSDWAAELFNAEETTEPAETAETTEPAAEAEAAPEAPETTETAETTAEATEPAPSAIFVRPAGYPLVKFPAYWTGATETEAETTAEAEPSETAPEATPETKEEPAEPTEATEATKATEPAPAFYMRPSGLSVYVDFDPEPDEEPTEPAEAEPSEVNGEATAETTAEPAPVLPSIFVRFASDYSAAVGWELTARRAGTHSTIDAAAFGELHRLARSIVQDRETFHGLTVRQQTITAAVDSIASADAFNAIHTKAAADALERFAADIAPTAAQLDEWTAPEDSTKIEERRADLPEPAPLPDAIPEPIAEGSDRWAKYDDVELNGATVDYVARRLFDVLPPRPSVGVLTIPRRGDEPLEVPAEPLRRLDYRDRLQRIAEAADVSPEIAAKMIYMAPWIGYEEEPEPETVDEVKPAEVDEGKDEGAPELVGAEAAPTSGGLTWNDILSIDWSFYD